MAGFLGLALLPVAAAAVSPDAPTPMPVAIAQPIAAVSAPLMPARSTRRLSETGLLMLVGTGLLALGAVVRKTTPSQ